jgi:60 kDa SS-A/Ro ribonucleoprotein
MTNYAQHFSTLKTPQSEKADPAQVANSAGGHSFVLDKWKRLDRWLILGAEGGSYYASERKLVRENAQTVIECLGEDGPRAVGQIVAISDAGRAPKNDAAIFALAIAAGHKDEATRAAAIAALPKVCRIGTHLFQFAEGVQNFRGWGRGLRRAIGAWYGAKTTAELAHQVAKYQQRNGWSHRDLLRLSHPDPKHAEIYRWVIGQPAEARTVKRKNSTASYPAVGELPAFLAAFDELRKTTDAGEARRLIREHRFTHEMVPTELKNNPDVWAELLEHMPPTAMIRNLAKMTAVGLLAPMSVASRKVAEKLGTVEALRKARVHPIALLMALKVYQQGHGEKGKLTWSPSREVVDALDAAFYLAFDAIEPTGKRVLLALDVSGSMNGPEIAGCPGITPRIGSAAMAMVTARAEKSWHCVGFSSGVPGEFAYNSGRSMHHGYRAGLSELAISPRQRLDDVIRTIQCVPMGGTDCALPMLYAMARGLDVDIFHVYTDSETWHGDIHPHQALKAYRDKSGIDAKLAVVGMVSSGFTIADPNDAGMLDVVGFDSAAPAVLADFAR